MNASIADVNATVEHQEQTGSRASGLADADERRLMSKHIPAPIFTEEQCSDAKFHAYRLAEYATMAIYTESNPRFLARRVQDHAEQLAEALGFELVPKRPADAAVIVAAIERDVPSMAEGR